MTKSGGKLEKLGGVLGEKSEKVRKSEGDLRISSADFRFGYSILDSGCSWPGESNWVRFFSFGVLLNWVCFALFVSSFIFHTVLMRAARLGFAPG